jgi:hypothetical protein
MHKKAIVDYSKVFSLYLLGDDTENKKNSS